MLAGFPDRVARAAGDRGELALADGGHAVRAPSARRDRLVLVLEASERKNRPALVRIAMPLSADWLLDLFADALDDRTELLWNEERGRVEQLGVISYRGLTLEESRQSARPSERASRILLDAARRAGLHRPDGDPELERLLARAAFAAQQSDAAPSLDAEPALEALCQGHTRLDEVRGKLVALLEAELSSAERQLLRDLAPERVKLSSGRELEVSYPPGGEAYVASYLQDFFGAREGPRAGHRPLVLHLWAPNRRSLQVTRDLESFWASHYPALRRQLARRYPKHFWPEHPSAAPAKRLARQ
jgi:ATP-dependent helicase HrpB